MPALAGMDVQSWGLLVPFWVLAVLGPPITLACTLRHLRRHDRDWTYLWVVLAFLASTPGELGRFIGYPFGAEWVVSHLYPGAQYGLFTIASHGPAAGLLVALITCALASYEISTISIMEPSVLAKTVGAVCASAFALWRWTHPLKDVVLIYCAAGALAYLVWLPHAGVESAANTITYSVYQGTRVCAFGMFIYATRRQ